MLTATLFVLLFLAGCVLSFFRHPIFGVALYVLVVYVNPPERWWGYGLLGDVRWSLLTVLVIVLSMLIHPPKPKETGFFAQPLIIGLLLFVVWLAVQSAWAMDPVSHQSLLVYYLKIFVAIYLIYRCLDSTESVRIFLWAHVIGCSYFAWIVFTTHVGGRFDEFRGAGIDDANAGALAIVTSVLCAGALFLTANNKGRLLLIVVAPLLLNAIVATISRSAFLALVVGGLVFNLFSPPAVRKWVAILSVLGLAAFLMLTNSQYWGRIETIEARGAQVEGVDTGHKRLMLMQAQLQMAKQYPMGCGSRCTDVLSPQFLPESNLNSARGARSSHNTFLTMLVEQGIPGAVLYIGMVIWIFSCIRKFWNRRTARVGVYQYLYSAVAASLTAIILGDIFVQYPRFEVRFWFLTLAMVLVAWSAEPETASRLDERPAGGRRPSTLGDAALKA